MYLSKLEIFGFKSFANKTTIEFTKGITGIVGPNGCGKTNIVDAIRWSLGEQKTSILRSDKMENVIFNGTREKKPMGMSEVSLTLVNDDNLLPTEYSEVTVTRRIFRSGESEYLLNKNICRLKDITNLFMDTGMGTNTYSVIELKMVETILSNKADDRRQMFEEAAGVNKYKLRRRLALKKLDDVKLNLTRVNDIVSEVEKKVRSLERQAKKASKYSQFQSVLREKEIDLCERELALYTQQIESLSIQKSEIEKRKFDVDNKIKEIENQLIIYREKINSIETELRNKQSEISEQTESIHSVQNNISVSEERLKLLQNNIERFNTDLTEFREQTEDTNAAIIEKDGIEKDITGKLQIVNDEINQLSSLLEIKKNEVENKKNTIKLHNDEKLEKFQDLNEKEIHLEKLKSSMDRNNKDISLFNEKIQKLTNTIAKTVGYLEDLSNEKIDVEKKLKESESIFVTKKDEKEDLEKTLSLYKQQELELKSSLSGLKDKIDFFKTLITNLDGISKGSKLLIESEGWTDKEKTLFADVGDTSEDFRFAMEAALKFVLNNLLIESTFDLKKAIDYLGKNDLGKASFFILQDSLNGKKTLLNRINNFSLKKNRRKLESEVSFINWAQNLVNTEQKWKPYFDKVLQNTAIVENLDAALKLISQYPNFNFATRNGDIVHSSGIVEAGSSPKLDETLFGRKQLLENLINDYPKLENKLKTMQNLITECETDLQSIDLNILTEEGKLLLNDINNIERQIGQLEFEKNKLSEEIEKSQSEIEILTNSNGRLEAELDKLHDEINEKLESKKSFDERINRLEDELKFMDNDYNNRLTEFNGKKLEHERLNGQLQNIKNEIESAHETKIKILNSISKNEAEINSASEQIESLKNIIEENKIHFEELNNVKQNLADEAGEISSKLSALKEESSSFEKELNNYRSERETISDDLHEREMKISEIKYKLRTLNENIKEEYSLDLHLKEFSDLNEFDFENTRNQVHDLKLKLKNLGPINLLAYSEYEEEKERFEFLDKQRKDLVESEKDLVQTIKEINTTAQTQFAETFTKIKENFKKIFQTLFDPGDEADLITDSDADPLDGKIEIIAKPKGKRPTSIEQLSQGEKTLTATALLFAIYLVKPSPFCIMDEVDAPLDDANIDRFAKLLNKFNSNTQFILVTHNKRTMEIAENMYGVTMQEEGISKLAGVQFNEEIIN